MTIRHVSILLQCLFAICWWFVIIVSVVDAYLLSFTRDVIAAHEMNPAGNALLAIANGQVWLFLLLKFFGTVLACACLLLMFRKNPRLGLTVTMVIALFQLGLLVFLCCA